MSTKLRLGTVNIQFGERYDPKSMRELMQHVQEITRFNQKLVMMLRDGEPDQVLTKTSSEDLIAEWKAGGHDCCIDLEPGQLVGRFSAGTGSFEAITIGGGLFLDESGVLTAPGDGSGVEAIVGGSGIEVDSTDPAHPIVGLSVAAIAALALANTAVQPGDNVSVLTNDAGYITSASLPVGADPSALVGLVTVPGVALTFMRSDAAPAIDQGIGPLWTNDHTWDDNAEVRLGAGGDLRIYHDGTDSFLNNQTGDINIGTVAGDINLLPLGTFPTSGDVRLTRDHNERTRFIISNPHTGTLAASQITLLTDSTVGFGMAFAGTGYSGPYLPNMGSGAGAVLYTSGPTGVQLALGTGDVARMVLAADGTLADWYVNALRMRRDGDVIRWGASDDLTIVHDGTNSVIRNDTGELRLQAGTTVGLAVTAAGTLSSAQDAAWSGQHVFSVNPRVIHAGNASIQLQNTSAPSGTRTWELRVNNAGDAAIVFDSDVFGGLGSAMVFKNTTGNAQLPTDNQELQLGASQDLRLFHDGTNSFVRNDTGQLRLTIGSGTIAALASRFFSLGNTSLSSDISGSSTMLGVKGIGANNIGSVKIESAGTANLTSLELYAADTANEVGFFGNTNSPMFWWTNAVKRMSLTAAGNLQMLLDNLKIQLGASQDLQLYHDGTNSIISNATGDLIVNDSVGGSVSFRQKRIELSVATATAALMRLTQTGIADWFFGMNASDSRFIFSNSGSTMLAIGSSGGHVQLPNDNEELRLGASDDMRLYHDGTSSFVRTDTGELWLYNAAGGSIRLRRAGGAPYVAWYDSAGTTRNGYLQFQDSSGGGHMLLSNEVVNGDVRILGAGGTAVFSFMVNGSTESARMDLSSTANDTRLMLWDVSAGALVRVSRGATDSGGTGFRLLRVPN